MALFDDILAALTGKSASKNGTAIFYSNKDNQELAQDCRDDHEDSNAKNSD